MGVAGVLHPSALVALLPLVPLYVEHLEALVLSTGVAEHSNILPAASPGRAPLVPELLKIPTMAPSRRLRM